MIGDHKMFAKENQKKNIQPYTTITVQFSMFSDVITVFSLSNQKSKSKNSDMIGERQSW